MIKLFDVREGRIEPTKEYLNTTIKKTGITKKELTEMLGISVNTMTNWISGTHPICLSSGSGADGRGCRDNPKESFFGS